MFRCYVFLAILGLVAPTAAESVLQGTFPARRISPSVPNDVEGRLVVAGLRGELAHALGHRERPNRLHLP